VLEIGLWERFLAALILFGPIIALSVGIAAEMLTDLLMEVGAAPACTLAAGAIGWVLYRKFWPHSEEAPKWGPEQEPGEAAIAAPPM
jgi:hypothetical protein